MLIDIKDAWIRAIDDIEYRQRRATEQRLIVAGSSRDDQHRQFVDIDQLPIIRYSNSRRARLVVQHLQLQMVALAIYLEAARFIDVIDTHLERITRRFSQG